MANSTAVMPEWDYSMHSYFITSLAEPIESWLTAFPDLTVLPVFDQDVVHFSDGTDNPILWLHQPNQSADSFAETLQAIQAIRAEQAGAKIIVLTNQPDDKQTVALIQAGAMGVCHAYADQSVLTRVFHVVAEGGLWLGESVLQQLIVTTQAQVGSSRINVDTLLAKLTRREQQVAQQVAKGLTNKEIARELEITERTIKAHVASIFERLGAKDRLQLALMLNEKK